MDMGTTILLFRKNVRMCSNTISMNRMNDRNVKTHKPLVLRF